MANYPCKGCTERHIGCHGECVKYQDAVRENRNASLESRGEMDLRQFKIEQVIKMKRKRR